MAQTALRKVEKEVLYETYGRWLATMRALPAHTAHWIAGVVLPPHERYWISQYFLSYAENNTVASRGTSKSFVMGSMAGPLDALLHKSMDTLVVSASGFRGGKLLFEDARRLVTGELRSQKMPAPFLRKSSDSPKIIRQEPDRWMLKWTSASTVMTVPSNNEDAMRGIRARKTTIDERTFFDGEVVQAVIRPMMNVGGEFEKIASDSSQNAIYQISTIDYTFRDWWKEIDQMRALAKKEYEAMGALETGDHDLYFRSMAENKNELHTASFQYTRFDYTDLLIPTEIDDEDGVTYEVHYPLPKHLTPKDLIKWDDRDNKYYWYTYPVSKKSLEEPLLNGTMDEDLWLAENRNVWIEAAGAVYPDRLVKAASELPIYQPGDIEGMEDEFLPPVMYECGDPCVIGIDYARERDDFAIVVIRLGPLSDGKFDPSGTRVDGKGRTMYGQTPWSSVIWAESWPHTMASQAADKIRQLKERYNLVNQTPHGGPGAIGMDFRGGGGAVRDELALPKPPVINGLPDPSWKEPVKIYDPSDDSYMHYAAYEDEGKYWSGLRLLTPANAENWEWTRSTKAGMEQKQLYIGYWEAPGTWSVRMGITTTTGQKDQNSDEYLKWLVGYTAIKKLKNQLVRLQTEMTPSGLIRVFMPGRKGTEEGKKDLYSAFIYGWHIAREHLVNATKEDDSAPEVAPIMLTIGDDVGRRSAFSGWTSFNR